MSLITSQPAGKRRRLFAGIAAISLALLIVTGVFARNDWFPSTDPFTGHRTGWFGSQPQPAAPLPDPPLLLDKEYVYANDDLIAIEDANASAAPPSDLAVWRPSTGTWWVMGGAAGTQPATQAWGLPADETVPGDYDGDGKTDFSVFRPSSGMWYVIRSSDSAWEPTVAWGTSSDVRVPADYDGDGKTDRAVWRASDGVWYIVRSGSASASYHSFGTNGDIPAPADYDGDGRADLAVWRSSEQKFYSTNSSDGGLSVIALGGAGSKPVSADYDGDGKADHATRLGATWTIRQSSNNQTVVVPWQDASDLPVQNDYDGDGKVDIAVWRPTNSPPGTVGNWFIRQSGSANSLRQVQWGIAGDIPVPSFYRR